LPLPLPLLVVVVLLPFLFPLEFPFAYPFAYPFALLLWFGMVVLPFFFVTIVVCRRRCLFV